MCHNTAKKYRNNAYAYFAISLVFVLFYFSLFPFFSFSYVFLGLQRQARSGKAVAGLPLKIHKINQFKNHTDNYKLIMAHGFIYYYCLSDG